MKVIEWKSIKGFEELYKVSNLGNVKNAKTNKNSKPVKNKTGYMRVNLSKNGIKKNFHIHRLVAEAFIPNPENKPQVNHKDENLENNCVDNLEWCDSKYNTNYGERNKKIANKLSKKINQFSLVGEYLKTWNSSMEIERTLGINQSNICLCCNGKRVSAGGYKWNYLLEKESDK